MAVVVANGCGGVLFHEAVGHPLEADAVDKEASVYRELVGTAVRQRADRRRGRRDDRQRLGLVRLRRRGRRRRSGRCCSPTGVLQGFLQDRMRAAKMGVEPTGNARRESYAHPPVVRMTNTNILPGASDPAQIIRDTARGIYVRGLGGGQVNPATGDFVFGVSEGYLIERGEVTTPVRGANLIGRAIDVMSAGRRGRVSDFETWEGVCGKDGQSAPVGSGSPTVRIVEDHGRRHRCLTCASSRASRRRRRDAGRAGRGLRRRGAPDRGQRAPRRGRGHDVRRVARRRRPRDPRRPARLRVGGRSVRRRGARGGGARPRQRGARRARSSPTACPPPTPSSRCPSCSARRARRFGVDDKVAMALELERYTVSRDPRVTKLDLAQVGDAVSRVAIASTDGRRRSSTRAPTRGSSP